jgi:O-antigen/teichoic acid export membrane protein
VTASYPVMVILLLPFTCILSQAASSRILYGMARHKSLAWVTSMEGIANIVLSIVLIRPFGIIGDALGTAIPLSCTALFFLPRHLCRVLNIRVATFLTEAYTLPVLLSLPTIATLLLMRRWFFAHNYLQVGLQILISLIPYGIGLAWAFWTGRVWRIEKPLVEQPLDEVGVALIGTYQDEQ